MLHGQGSHGKEWLNLCLSGTWHDSSVYATTQWCPNTAPDACVLGKIQIPGPHLRLAESESPVAEPGALFVKYLPRNSQSMWGLSLHPWIHGLLCHSRAEKQGRDPRSYKPPHSLRAQVDGAVCRLKRSVWRCR